VGVTLVAGLYRDLSLDAIDTALCSGITKFDAASNYGAGGAHRRLREAATRRDIDFDTLEITSKIGFTPKNGDHSLDEDTLTQSAEQIRKNLGRSLDLLYVHNPEVTLATLRPHRRLAKIRECVRVMRCLCGEGLARAWGIASWNGFGQYFDLGNWQEEEPGPAGIMVPGSVLSPRYPYEAVNACGPITDPTRDSLGVTVAAPLAGGAVLSAPSENLARFLSRAHSPVPALSVVASVPGVDRIACGMSSTAHITANLQALQETAVPEKIVKLLQALAT